MTITVLLQFCLNSPRKPSTNLTPGPAGGLENKNIWEMGLWICAFKKNSGDSWDFPHGWDGKDLPIVQEMQVPSLGREDPLEKELATHSSILAWRIPWMEEPGGLQSMGSQRVGHD